MACPQSPFQPYANVQACCTRVASGDPPPAGYTHCVDNYEVQYGADPLWCDLDLSHYDTDNPTNACGFIQPRYFVATAGPSCCTGLNCWFGSWPGWTGFRYTCPFDCPTFNPDDLLCYGEDCTGEACFKLLDYCTRAPIAGATVLIAGTPIGSTNAQGIVCASGLACTPYSTADYHEWSIGSILGYPSIANWFCDPPQNCAGWVLPRFDILSNNDRVTVTVYMNPTGGCPSSPCPPGEEWCDATGTCITVTIPDCAAELSCGWNTSQCQWVCQVPVCADGEQWDWQQCECKPCDYGDGECWCESTSTCVPCPDPPCKAALLCYWDSTLCDWVCEDPTDPASPLYCPPPNAWDWYDCRCEPQDGPEGDGIDLAQTANRWIHRVAKSSQSGTSVRHEVTRDKGATWSTPVVIATDAAPGAAPTIVATRQDELLVAYHDGDDDAQIYRSDNYGSAWSLQGLVANVSYPRLAVDDTVLYLAGYNGTGIAVYRSDSKGLFWDHLATLTGMPNQLPAFEVDRHGFFHLFYVDSAGAMQHRDSQDGVTWDGPTLVTSTGTYPVLATGIERGPFYYLQFPPVLPRVWYTDETHGALAQSRFMPTGTYESDQWPGLLVDEQETWYICLREDGTGLLVTRYSTDRAGAWHAPV